MAGQGIANDERLVRVGRVRRVGPEVNQTDGRRDGVRRSEGKKIEIESKPLVLVGVVHMEGSRKGRVAAVIMVVMRGAESEEVEMGSGGDEVHERWRGQDLVKELANGAVDHDLTKGEGREDLLKCVFWETVDRRVLHFRRWRCEAGISGQKCRRLDRNLGGGRGTETLDVIYSFAGR